VNKPKEIMHLQRRRIKDYSFTIAFFLIFSFFVVFAIRPNLITAISLNKELDDLKIIDKNYEDTVMNIVGYQSLLERNRDQFYLLDEALPPNPQLSKLVSDLSQDASSSAVILKRVDINQVNLVKQKNTKDLSTYLITIDTAGEFSQVNTFIQTLLNQRRLKILNSTSISKDLQSASGSGSLRIQLVVQGQYL
jgi:Tfp pilus assembly protein PilO